MEVLVNFLESLHYISVEKLGDIELSDKQKAILDERRLSVVEEENIPWKEAKNNWLKV